MPTNETRKIIAALTIRAAEGNEHAALTARYLALGHSLEASLRLATTAPRIGF